MNEQATTTSALDLRHPDDLAAFWAWVKDVNDTPACGHIADRNPAAVVYRVTPRGRAALRVVR